MFAYVSLVIDSFAVLVYLQPTESGETPAIEGSPLLRLN